MSVADDRLKVLSISKLSQRRPETSYDKPCDHRRPRGRGMIGSWVIYCRHRGQVGSSVVAVLVVASLWIYLNATVYAIVNDRLSPSEVAIIPDMGHDGWVNDVTLSNIHQRSLFTSRFHLYKNTKESMETPLECISDLLQNQDTCPLIKNNAALDCFVSRCLYVCHK